MTTLTFNPVLSVKLCGQLQTKMSDFEENVLFFMSLQIANVRLPWRRFEMIIRIVL